MPDGAGIYFHLRALDRAGNWATSAAHLGPFNIDTSLPSNPKSVSALSQVPGKWSGNATVTAAWSGAASPLSGVAGYSVLWDHSPLTVPPADGINPAAGNETCTTVLADGDNWYFHIRTRNNAGSWAAGAVHFGPILIDLTPPATTAVAINSNAGFTGSTTVTVGINASDATPGSGVAELSLSVDGANWGGWELFSGSRTVTVPDGNGTRTVHVRTRDAVGNIGAPRSDDIVLDRTAPAGLAVQINGGAPACRNRTVALTLAASDPEPASGVGEMSFSEDGSSWSPWEPFKTTKDWTFRSDGNRTVHFRVRDAVLNAAGPVSAVILVDTSLPKILGTVVTRTGTKSATVQVTTDEPCTVVVEYGTGRTYGSTVRTDSSSTDATMVISPLKAGTNYHFRVSVTDRGGNPATVSEDQKFATKSDAKTPMGLGPLIGALAAGALLGLMRRRGPSRREGAGRLRSI
jgi:hypothetical protein